MRGVRNRVSRLRQAIDAARSGATRPTGDPADPRGFGIAGVEASGEAHRQGQTARRPAERQQQRRDPGGAEQQVLQGRRGGIVGGGDRSADLARRGPAHGRCEAGPACLAEAAAAGPARTGTVRRTPARLPRRPVGRRAGSDSRAAPADWSPFVPPAAATATTSRRRATISGTPPSSVTIPVAKPTPSAIADNPGGPSADEASKPITRWRSDSGSAAITRGSIGWLIPDDDAEPGDDDHDQGAEHDRQFVGPVGGAHRRSGSRLRPPIPTSAAATVETIAPTCSAPPCRIAPRSSRQRSRTNVSATMICPAISPTRRAPRGRPRRRRPRR